MTHTVDKTTIQLLNELGRKHFTYLFDHFEIRYSDRGDYVNAKCPVASHPGDNDNPTAFSFRYDTGQWACWSHHCEDMFGRDVIGLVMAIKDVTFGKAVEWLKEFIENLIDLSIEKIDINTIDIEKKKQNHVVFIHKPLPESLLNYLSDDLSYLINRGFDVSILEKYQVGYWHRFGTYMHERIIIPIRDVEGRLVGFTGRSIYEEEEWLRKHNFTNNPDIKYPKWLHGRGYVKKNVDSDFYKTSVVFNLNNVQGNYDTIILVEGPLDGFKLEMAGIFNWGACLGSKVVPLQQHLLLQSGIKKLILAFDADKAGKKCAEKAVALMSDDFEIETLDLPEPYDVGALNVDTIRRLIG